MSRRALFIAVWLLVVALCVGNVFRTRFTADLSAFLPSSPTEEQALLVDLHSEGIPHYFEGGLTATHVYTKAALVPALRRLGGADFVLGSTDAGRAKWVESLANDLGVDAAFILKRRVSGSETVVQAVNAEVRGRRVVIYDDMIRTGGSLIGAARAYKDAGATSIVAVCTHGVFPPGSWERLTDSGLFNKIAATDSHPCARDLAACGLELIPITPLLAAHLES